jgi:hypothetical protein
VEVRLYTRLMKGVGDRLGRPSGSGRACLAHPDVRA